MQDLSQAVRKERCGRHAIPVLRPVHEEHVVSKFESESQSALVLRDRLGVCGFGYFDFHILCFLLLLIKMFYGIQAKNAKTRCFSLNIFTFTCLIGLFIDKFQAKSNAFVLFSLKY